MSIKQQLAVHLVEHPDCTELTCPHTKNYIATVLFMEPDNGFFTTVQAFSKTQAEQVLVEGVANTHPHLTLKKVEVDICPPNFVNINAPQRSYEH